MASFIISIKPCYWALMESGNKTAELRRRPLRLLAPGDRVWVYATKPTGSIVGYAIVSHTLLLPSDQAWREYAGAIAMPRRCYLDYTADTEQVSLVMWQAIHKLHHSLSLWELRAASPKFQPPQFYARFSLPDHLVRSQAAVAG